MSHPLADWHERRGGHLVPVPGSAIDDANPAVRPQQWVASYPGTTPSEPFDPQHHVALVDRSWTGRLELVGEDRHRFLNGLVTCDTSEQALPAGAVRYGYFTDGRGRVMADTLVLSLLDRIWLELPAGRQKLVRQHLEKYIVADRVDVRPLGDFVSLALVGSRVCERVRQAYGLEADALTAAGTVRLGTTELFVHPHPRLGVPAVQIWVSSGIAEPVVEDLQAGLDLSPIGNADLEPFRVCEGVPFWGVDFDEGNLPGELAVEGAVDYDKGCYLGQEVVARMHYRGRPAQELRRVHGQGPPPEAGAELVAAAAGETAPGRPGRIKSAVADPRDPAAWAGLAMLPKALLDEETLTLEGRPVRVVARPSAVR